MSKRLLRSVIVAAFSVVLTFGALSGSAVEKERVRADSSWSSSVALDAVGGARPAAFPNDSSWS